MDLDISGFENSNSLGIDEFDLLFILSILVSVILFGYVYVLS